tara:strand:- start:231 stop:575 length:345 start_codon:yes stop_codon:yes gene_type:complete
MMHSPKTMKKHKKPVSSYGKGTKMKVNFLFLRFIILSFLLSLFCCCNNAKFSKEDRKVIRAKRSINRKERKNQRASKRHQKKAYKSYWKRQTKDAKKSIKRNNRRLKRKHRHRI